VDADKGGKLIKLIPEDKVQQILPKGWNRVGINIVGNIVGLHHFWHCNKSQPASKKIGPWCFFLFFSLPNSNGFSRLKQWRIAAQG